MRLFVPMYSLSKALTATGSRILQRSTQAPKHAQMLVKNMSVMILDDEKDMSQFISVNEKSVVYFTASWCPPCKQISPVYDKLSERHDKGGLGFAKVDIDKNDQAAFEYEIQAVPTFIFFDGKEIKERFTGADVGQLETLVGKYS